MKQITISVTSRRRHEDTLLKSIGKCLNIFNLTSFLSRSMRSIMILLLLLRL